MEVTRRSTILSRLQYYAFIVLFLIAIGMLAWLSTRYVVQADWTTGGRNTLSVDSQRLLDKLDGTLTITAFAREDKTLRGHIEILVAKYQRYYDRIELDFVNPDVEPDRVREEGITMDGELILKYRQRHEPVKLLTEQAVSNALLRIALQGERWISFISGHGERNPTGQANFDLGAFNEHLERRGLKVQSLNLARTPSIPSNTHALVIASPQISLLPGEAKLISRYVEGGGNLLWMMEPGELAGLDALAEQLGIEVLPGVVVDATTQLFGIESPDFAVIVEYPGHAITSEMNVLTLFPRSTAFELNEEGPWNAQPLLTTLERAWTETGELVDEIHYDAGSDERPGPLDIGIALTRELEKEDESGTPSSTEQRILVLGDGDFLSNTYLGNGGNLDLGLNMIRWLSHDDAFISIRPKAAPDQALNLSPTMQGVIGFGFLFGLPGALLLSGVVIWTRRRKR